MYVGSAQRGLVFPVLGIKFSCSSVCIVVDDSDCNFNRPIMFSGYVLFLTGLLIYLDQIKKSTFKCQELLG